MPETLRSWANGLAGGSWCGWWRMCASTRCNCRSEEHTSELQSRLHLVCRLLLEKIRKSASGIRLRASGAYSRPVLEGGQLEVFIEGTMLRKNRFSALLLGLFLFSLSLQALAQKA